VRLAALRTALTGVDPGLVRLQLAAVATASMRLRPESCRGCDNPSTGYRTVTAEAGQPRELAQTTRQVIQVGVATSLAIIIGELVSPARWYWAVIAAFVIFAGTNSRGDILSRGMQRVIGTVGGVIAGMGLAVVVGSHHLVALVLMLCCALWRCTWSASRTR
jgi:uncharacterized membrane protein YccC